MERSTLESRIADVDLAIIGGGVGGVAAALAALRRGLRVVLTEETDRIGGQFTSQGVPPDEHRWIEQFGCTASYRRYRSAVRDYYRRWYPLTVAARNDPRLNPGLGRVGPLCHEPRVSGAVLRSLVDPYLSSGRLRILLRTRPVGVELRGDRVTGVTVERADAGRVHLVSPYYLDATELGDVLPLADVEHVTGFESRHDTGEPSGPEVAQPDNMQAISWVFAVEHREGEDHVIERPARYDYWRGYRPAYWPGPQIGLTAPDPRTLAPLTRTFTPNARSGQVVADQSQDPGDRELWEFRRVVARELYEPGFVTSDVTLVNWPMIDYLDGPLIGVGEEEKQHHLRGARELSASMLYWLQTEAPRPDGGQGWPGLRLRPDVMDTVDGFAAAPYIRESRRIRAEYTVVEQDLSLAVRGDAGAVAYDDTVGVGMYRIDLHPSTGGDNYIDIASCPFQIPLGALLPVRIRNLLPAGKNIGTTHITNGCYRLHPVEWNIGEAAGSLVAYCHREAVEPHDVRRKEQHLRMFQSTLVADGVELAWPEVRGY
ncbi:FAD-dependent oxidoreductase [Plantactinospora sp. KLBMP9567]|uniref:FAD-dependent oxidoreductase n=1 Tax=Plantactinospora sp. KLBMP9567 TaxID=3085900 RepID=UPI0029822583|nr:FAD-dependent oxidoreductase [Plantactinospora sp. KLBMP9567]MDW5324429.1 FAD-dependent oxidoreductase [Plantactinospora sp. KLBMP9567]